MVNGDSITETMLKYTRKNKEKLDISEGHEQLNISILPFMLDLNPQSISRQEGRWRNKSKLIETKNVPSENIQTHLAKLGKCILHLH